MGLYVKDIDIASICDYGFIEEQNNFNNLIECEIPTANVLLEFSFDDIINKIKDLWKRFKEWFKGLMSKLFNTHNIVHKKSEIMDKVYKKNKDKIDAYSKKQEKEKLHETASGNIIYEATQGFVHKVWMYNDNRSQISDTENLISNTYNRYTQSLSNLVKNFINYLRLHQNTQEAKDKYEAFIQDIGKYSTPAELDLVEVPPLAGKVGAHISVFASSASEFINDQKNKAKDAGKWLDSYTNNLEKSISESENLYNNCPYSDNTEVKNIYLSSAANVIRNIKAIYNGLINISNKLIKIEEYYNNELERLFTLVFSGEDTEKRVGMATYSNKGGYHYFNSK